MAEVKVRTKQIDEAARLAKEYPLGTASLGALQAALKDLTIEETRLVGLKSRVSLQVLQMIKQQVALI